MDSGAQMNESGDHDQTTSSTGVVLPVSVGDGVDQVVFSLDDGLMSNEQTTYIIQFVDNANTITAESSAVTTEVSTVTTEANFIPVEAGVITAESSALTAEVGTVTAEPSTVTAEANTVTEGTGTVQQDVVQQSIALEGKTDDPVPDTDISQSAPELGPCSETVSENILTVNDEKEQEKSDLRKALDLGPVGVAKSTNTDEQVGRKTSDDNDSSTDTNTSPRKTNRRNIKKPKRFSDAADLKRKKKKEPIYIQLPKITKKRLSLQDMCIEFEIEEQLFVSSLEKFECIDGFCKYSISVSKTPFTAKSETTTVSKKKVPELTQEKEKSEPSKKVPVVKIKKEDIVEPPGDKGKTRSGAKRVRKMETRASKAAVKRRKVDEPTVTIEVDQSTEDKTTETKEEEEIDDPPIEANDEEEDPCDRLSALDDIVKAEGILISTKEEENQDIDKDDGTGNVKEETSGEPDSKVKKPKTKTIKIKKKEKKKKDSENDQDNGETKPKRKYTKRNAYNRDDLNYSVTKSETGQKLYKCNHCGTELKYHGNMKDHCRTHTKETPFVCADCGKGFGNQSNYNHHLAVHSTERPYVCQVCHFGFKSKTAHKRHQRRHFGIATHTCDYCGKGFFSSTELLKHIVVHTGERNYQCEYCSRKFNNDSSLIRHRYLHTGGGRHVCHLCGEKFIRKDYFRNHLLKTHNEECKLPYRQRVAQINLPTTVYLNQDEVPLVNNEIEIAAQEIQIIMTN